MFGVLRTYYIWLLYELLQAYFLSIDESLSGSVVGIPVKYSFGNEFDFLPPSAEEADNGGMVLEVMPLQALPAEIPDYHDSTPIELDGEPWPELFTAPYPVGSLSDERFNEIRSLEKSYVFEGKGEFVEASSKIEPNLLMGTTQPNNTLYQSQGVSELPQASSFVERPQDQPDVEFPHDPAGDESPQDPPDVVVPENPSPVEAPQDPLDVGAPRDPVGNAPPQDPPDIVTPEDPPPVEPPQGPPDVGPPQDPDVNDPPQDPPDVVTPEDPPSVEPPQVPPDVGPPEDSTGNEAPQDPPDVVTPEDPPPVDPPQVSPDVEPPQDPSPGTPDEDEMNMAPTATGSQVNLVEDAVKVLGASDFDVDDSDNATAELTIVFDGMTNGSLLLNGVELKAKDEFSMQEVADGNISYQPGKNDDGVETFSYAVKDPGGLIDNGSIEFNITAVADTPTFEAMDVTMDASSRSVTLDFSSTLADLDGSETLTLDTSSVPHGVTVTPSQFTDGDGDGQISGSILMEPSQGFVDPFTLTFAATATESSSSTSTATQGMNVMLGTTPFLADSELILSEAGLGSILNISALQTEDGFNSGSYLGSIEDSYTILGLGDLDGDGRGEIICTQSGVGGVSVFAFQTESGSIGSNTTPDLFGIVDNSYSVEFLGDVDGDGSDEIIVSQTGGAGVDIYAFQAGNGLFDTNTNASFVRSIDSSYDIQFMGDVDGDGDNEIIATRGETYGIDVYAFQTETNPFDPNINPDFLGTIDNSYSIEFMEDVDGDGAEEIIATQSGATAVDVFVFQTEDAPFDSNTTPSSLGTISDTANILGFGNVDEVGRSGADTLTGTEDMDILLGFGGDDNLNGFEGNDLLIGGEGNDILTGGLGEDVFKFDLNENIGNDAVTDYIVAEDILAFENVMDINDVSVIDDGFDVTLSFGSNAGAGDGGSVTIQGIGTGSIDLPDLIDAGVMLT